MKYNKHFSRFEQIARQLFEHSFQRWFGNEQISVQQIAVRLAHAMEDNHRRGEAPNIYFIRLHPTNYELLLAENPQINTELELYLKQMADQVGLLLTHMPQVTILQGQYLPLRHIQVEVDYQQANITSETRSLARNKMNNLQIEIERRDAFLIIAGGTPIPLKKPIITIGRHMDNDIVLDSSSVSRHHAQIRWRYSRFILYDLSRYGNSFLNQQKIEETVLQPGDIIGISHIPLIYGEGMKQQLPTKPEIVAMADEETKAIKRIGREE